MVTKIVWHWCKQSNWWNSDQWLCGILIHKTSQIQDFLRSTYKVHIHIKLNKIESKERTSMEMERFSGCRL